MVENVFLGVPGVARMCLSPFLMCHCPSALLSVTHHVLLFPVPRANLDLPSTLNDYSSVGEKEETCALSLCQRLNVGLLLLPFVNFSVFNER